ncbi:MAG: hypothetical protein GXP29_04215 [Planctomycetes bacterium]|nr:hypothetical protein [Planctomycetota bacterium]
MSCSPVIELAFGTPIYLDHSALGYLGHPNFGRAGRAPMADRSSPMSASVGDNNKPVIFSLSSNTIEQGEHHNENCESQSNRKLACPG